MTTTRDKEAAEQWASERCPGQDSGDIVWCMSKEDFLAGCQHARAEQKELLTWTYKVRALIEQYHFGLWGDVLKELKKILPEEK